MSFRRLIFRPPIPSLRLFNVSDVVALLLVAVLIYLGVRLAFNTPTVVRGPDISLSPSALPYYALLSLRRMLAAYVLSLTFSLIYGYTAARRPGTWRFSTVVGTTDSTARGPSTPPSGMTSPSGKTSG